MADNPTSTDVVIDPDLQRKLTLFALLDARHKADGALLAEARKILTGELELDFKETGSTGRVLKVDGVRIGKAGVNENGDTVILSNPKAYQGWVEENYADEVEYVTESRVKDAFAKGHLSTKRLKLATTDDGEPILDDDGNQLVIDTKLGIPVDGVKIKKGEGIRSFTIRSEPGVDLAALAAGVDDYEFIRTPKQITDHETVEGEVVEEQDIVDADVVEDEQDTAA